MAELMLSPFPWLPALSTEILGVIACHLFAAATS